MLANAVRNYPDPFRDNSANRSYLLGLGIIRHYLGEDWLRHIDPTSARPGFMRVRDGNDLERQLTSWRVTDLGEVLLNLQNVLGFDAKMREMRTADPEASVAELHIARAIYINGWGFRFVDRVGERGRDYDFEIESAWDGLKICADAKCKIEETPLSEKTILNTLVRSRSQLPEDSPGMFCVKIPASWLDEPNGPEVMVRAAQSYFRPNQRQRVVEVMYYAEPVGYENGIMFQGHRFKEVVNPYHRWGTDRDWRLLERWRPQPDNPNAMPLAWIRLINITPEGYRVRF